MELDSITGLAHHCLHLCNNSNIDDVVFSYIINADSLVTNKLETWKRKFEERGISCPADLETWKRKFGESGINCRVKKPGLIRKGERIIVDGSSLGDEWKKWEKIWEKQNRAICIYNLDEPNSSSILKDLVNVHERMILSIDKIRMLSDKNLEGEINNLNPEIVESLVKKELKNILISLLLSKPMCGVDLVKILYEKFKVFISPGMLYPTLHALEKEGLISYDYKIKNKIYKINEKNNAELLLKNHIQVTSLLSKFLIKG